MSAQEGAEIQELEVVPAPTGETEAKAEAKPEGQEQKEGQERDEAGKFRRPVQPRIDELTRQRREAERERDYWRARAEITPKAEAPKPEKPTPDKFTTYDEYVEALTDWKADQKIDAKLTEREKAAAERAEADKRQSTWHELETAARDRYSDFDEVMEAADGIRVTDTLAQALRDSGNGPELTYHLTKNPDLVRRLNNLPVAAAARELGKFEASIAPAKTPEPETDEAEETPEPVRAVKKSAAPPPPSPVRAARSGAVNLATANMDDYIKTRRTQGARWAR